MNRVKVIPDVTVCGILITLLLTLQYNIVIGVLVEDKMNAKEQYNFLSFRAI